MATIDRVIEKLNGLTAEQQEEVLRLVEYLGRHGASNHRTDPFGLLGKLNLDVTAADIDAVWREL
ncbi:MAG: hypothetical protein AB1716_12970 [Planctomycetota bacterium]